MRIRQRTKLGSPVRKHQQWRGMSWPLLQPSLCACSARSVAAWPSLAAGRRSSPTQNGAMFDTRRCGSHSAQVSWEGVRTVLPGYSAAANFDASGGLAYRETGGRVHRGAAGKRSVLLTRARWEGSNVRCLRTVATIGTGKLFPTSSYCRPNCRASLCPCCGPSSSSSESV